MHQSGHSYDLSADQAATRAKCFHVSGGFVEFSAEEIEQSIPERFEKMVRKFPDRIALKAHDQCLTYFELNSSANRLAGSILARCGYDEKPVGVLLPKGTALVIAVLGILKSRKNYILLDPSHPTPRNGFILNHAQASLIVTDTGHVPLARDLTRREQIIDLASANCDVNTENPAVNISPDSIAWIHYTSGSTGEPKGVIQTHRNALHRVMYDTNVYHISPNDRFTFPASRGGDMFLALLNGASVLPLEINEEGFSGLDKCLRQNEITILSSVTSAFRHFMNSLHEDKQFPHLRLIRLIGEPLYKIDVELFKKHFSRHCILLNRLGSNETGTFCQYFMDHSTPIADGVVPVGYPVEDADVLLLNDAGKEVGNNEIGEFAVRSRHIAIGYWRNRELTAQAFKSDLEGGNQRIYRTGDFGRRLPNGCFVHLGRKDFQVKIRGNRVEIAEVEAALLSCAQIKEAAVIAKNDTSGDQKLIAYLVRSGTSLITESDIRRVLEAKLPAYMVPTIYVFLEKLPVTGIGKVDKRALPEPNKLNASELVDYSAPRNDTERILCRIWSDILGVERVGIDDDFFALGGHSLLAAKMFARLDEEFGRLFPLAVLIYASTVRLLAEQYCSSSLSKHQSVLIPLITGGTLPAIYAVPGVFGDVIGYAELSRALGADQTFYALQSVGLDGKAAPLVSVEQMANLYVRKIQEIQPHGPYALMGACFGAAIAYEMARQILSKGEEVAFLGLLDPPRRKPSDSIANGLRPPRIINFGKVFGNLLMARGQNYLKEILGFGNGNRLKFIRQKIRSVTVTGPVKTLKNFKRELHQVEVSEANRQALRRYHRKSLKGSLRIFDIFESSHPRNSADKFCWSTLWDGNTHRHFVSGKDSGDMISGENAHALASLIRERLQTAFSEDLNGAKIASPNVPKENH